MTFSNIAAVDIVPSSPFRFADPMQLGSEEGKNSFIIFFFFFLLF